ncbi:ATP-binding protein, partial [Streptomyces sp. BV333]|nr:ATP-binding protein [Streptomyces sp. BV333]
MATSVGLVAAHVGALVLGRRQAAPLELEEDLSAEERRLVERLDPSWWVQHAEGRGLAGTVTSPPEVTPGGLVSHVRLDNRWTPKSFQDKADQVRALLGARTDLRMEIGKGSHGDRATITLRTRSAADGDDLKWSYERQSFGVDTVTGDLVDIPLGERLLIAGRSGAGKSVASRPLLFKASEGEQNRLVIIDL